MSPDSFIYIAANAAVGAPFDVVLLRGLESEVSNKHALRDDEKALLFQAGIYCAHLTLDVLRPRRDHESFKNRSTLCEH
jgi:hypothetical protein